ncbi:hypothetical protein DPMN_184244 [Dreissena polymorpha]|uniref:Uncharacterized protein n=1 Tax=Dreissena polymorpha TaxID=45954 RepID=A0A9D4DLE2_DREPO|nr:hypothetical protein DPMN_184244 [Dreissena polymorpha]
MEYHNYLFKKHETLGTENINKWPFSTVNAQEKCQEHRKAKLTGFCEDYSELMSAMSTISTTMLAFNATYY